MTDDRFKVIRDYYWAQKEESGIYGEQAFFEMYDNNIITGPELDILMDQINF